MTQTVRSIEAADCRSKRLEDLRPGDMVLTGVVIETDFRNGTYQTPAGKFYTSVTEPVVVLGRVSDDILRTVENTYRQFRQTASRMKEW